MSFFSGCTGAASGDFDSSLTSEFLPQGVCSKLIRYEVRDGKLGHVQFTGGCDGNLKAIAALVRGMDLPDVLERLEGITCGKKSTSCADQLCRALRRHL
ncbi:MAG: TIGR03905 family TSCPD domain-containing protein [Desulfovibrionaceae bacterium]